jgi:glycosyltransferase involved in cell wall biosynthesis
MVTKEPPNIKKDTSSQMQAKLFLPPHPQRQGEGGLRTNGYFKKSFNDKPLISIITVVFNGQKYLEQTIQSVLNQSYDNVEYIIIDGGSTDGTLDIIRKYEHAIDYWVSEPDKGIYDAMNKGIDLFTGDWLYYLGSDDFLLRHAITNLQLQQFKTDTVVYSDVYMPRQHKIYDGKFSKYKLMLRNICHQSVFYGKDTIKGKFFDLSFKILSDRHMNMRLFVQYTFIYRPILICVYNDYDGYSTMNRDNEFHAQISRLIKINFGIYYYSLFLARKFFVGMMEFFHIKSTVKRILSK